MTPPKTPTPGTNPPPPEPLDEQAIRKDERERLARLFEDNADVLQSFQPDGLTTAMIAFLLRLDHS